MFIHGLYYKPEYQAYKNMIARCYKKRWNRWYKNIKVCDAWLRSFDEFYKYVGKRPSKLHSIDRIDSTKNYEPGNVRWAKKSTQSQNTKNYCTNKTGVRGVSWSKTKKKWRAHISVKNKSMHLGYFEKIQDAEKARQKAQKIHWKQ